MMQPEVASSDQQTASGGHVVVLVLSHCTLRISRFSTANAAADKVQELACGLDSWETNVGSGSEIVRM